MASLPGAPAPHVVANTAPPPGVLGLSLSFTDAAGAPLCTAGMTALRGSQCPVGTAQASWQGIPTCRPCDPGSACAGGAAAPAACAPGSFTAQLGASACQPCWPGAVTAQAGSNFCQECGAGTGPSPDRTTCTLCPGGTFARFPGSPCLACLPGTYREEGGGDGRECTKAPPGSAPAPDAKSAVECAPGTYSNAEGLPACLQW